MRTQETCYIMQWLVAATGEGSLCLHLVHGNGESGNHSFEFAFEFQSGYSQGAKPRWYIGKPIRKDSDYRKKALRYWCPTSVSALWHRASCNWPQIWGFGGSLPPNHEIINAEQLDLFWGCKLGMPGMHSLVGPLVNEATDHLEGAQTGLAYDGTNILKLSLESWLDLSQWHCCGKWNGAMLLQQKPSTPEALYTPLQKLAPTPAGHLVNLAAFYPDPMSIKAKSCTKILRWDLQ